MSPEESVDTLGRWMAYRVAELITRAEEADGDAAEAFKNQASKAILELWDHRTAWPRGWPPAAVKGVEEALINQRDHPWAQLVLPKRPTWLEAVAVLRQLQADELAAWIDRALIECPIDQAEEWLNQHGTLMDEDERGISSLVIALARRARGGTSVVDGFVETAGPASTRPGAASGLEGLETRIEELEESRRKLRDSIVPGWKTPPAPAKRRRSRKT
jgi:hypothetical protein